MNKNEKFVISINRELGSGGRTLGRKLSEKLGVEFYDKAVIKGLQEKYHLTIEEIEKLKRQMVENTAKIPLPQGITTIKSRRFDGKSLKSVAKRNAL